MKRVDKRGLCNTIERDYRLGTCNARLSNEHKAFIDGLGLGFIYGVDKHFISFYGYWINTIRYMYVIDESEAKN
jgi:hypothetical protein